MNRTTDIPLDRPGDDDAGEPKPLSKTQRRRLAAAQRQLERTREAIAKVVGEDYTTPWGEVLLNGVDMTLHHLAHTVEGSKV